MGKPLGLYVHLPFCQRKCAYCDFPSYAGQLSLREAYTDRVCAEIARRGKELGGPEADTVYLGGGTPSVMEAGQIARILSRLRESFRVRPDAEISCEVNPGTLKAGFLETLREQGVDRLSIGAQSADGAELRLLERVHSWEEAVETAVLARLAGFRNVNLDLMAALPGQTWETLKGTLEKALALQPEHLSCYSLIIEEGTPFHERFSRGELALPEEEAERVMYWDMVRLLEGAGYEHYEISNFARPGFRCRHNLNCWQREEYLGFGASAAGFYQGVRLRNPPGLQEYLQGEEPETESVSAEGARFEKLMLGLRLGEGVSLSGFAGEFGVGIAEAWPRALEGNIDAGLLEIVGGFLRLTRKGFDLMDRVLLDFLP